jgi:ABC-type antimicrobial peptide transport system permease subunit
VTISNRLFDRNYASPQDQLVGIKIHGGVSKANSQALIRRVTGFPDGKIQDRPTFVRNQEKGINKLLAVLYVLLALSILISVFGIVNTLVLTVFERTRELGMLRAVGMTRRQVRRMIRYESIVTSLIGAVLGIVVGAFLGFLIAKALHSSGIIFELPVSQLAAFLLASIVIGIIAAILPARRAARLNVLEALQYE